jgi:N-sulfoglucosamine sulfohydrolase
MKINISSLFLGIISISSLASEQKRPNVLFILSDDHSAPDLGCYGNRDLKTPNLDKLAKNGVLFQSAYTAAPQSVPSRAAFLTGRNVLAIDMLRFSSPLPREYVTFPEILRASGYHVGVLGRSYHLDGSDNGAPEMDIYKKLGLITFPERYNFVANSDPYDLIPKTEEFLNQVPKDAPYCLWANYLDPHRPWRAPAYAPNPDSIKVPSTLPDTKEVRKDLAAYYGEVNRLDENIGKLLAFLEKRGALKNTIIVFAGDNGCALLRGKGSLYRVGLNVPLIVNYPQAVQSGKVSDVLVSGIDLAPTLLELTGVKANKEIEGKSFVKVLKGSKVEYNDYVYAARGTHGSGLPFGNAHFDLSRTVFNKEYKLIYNPMWQLPFDAVDCWDEPFWADLKQKSKDGLLENRFVNSAIFTPQRPMFELFDLKKDPGEFVNLVGSPEYKDLEMKLKLKLEEWMIVNRDMVPLPVPAVPHEHK